MSRPAILSPRCDVGDDTAWQWCCPACRMDEMRGAHLLIMRDWLRSARVAMIIATLAVAGRQIRL